MGRHSTLPPDFIARVRQVAIARRRLPSDKQLAAEGGVSVRTVQTIMHETFPRVYADSQSDSPVYTLPGCFP